MPLLETHSKIVDIKIDFRCNNLCRFCVAGDKRELFPDLTLGDITKLMTEHRGRCDEIVLTGGEPTLHPDIFDIVRIARQDLGFKTVQIQTNGRMFVYHDFCEKMIEAGANEFAVSLHGHCAPLHDYLTGRPGSFTATAGGIRNLLRLKQNVVTNTVITKPNYRHLSEIARMLIALGLRQFIFSYPHIIGICAVNVRGTAPRMTLIAPHLKKALAMATDAGRISLTEAIPPCILRGFEQHIAERLHTSRTVVDCDGTIDDFHDHRMHSMKKKGPRCGECGMAGNCEGVWPDYPEHFSWDEFKPYHGIKV